MTPACNLAVISIWIARRGACGQLSGDMSVTGFSIGIERKYVGFNTLSIRNLGVYSSWKHDSGLYADSASLGNDRYEVWS